MEITQEIISDQIVKLNKHYCELEKLFENTIPKSDPIIDCKLKELLIIKKAKEHPDLVKEYPELKNYGDKTIYGFSVTHFPYDENELERKVEKAKEKNVLLPRRNKKSPWWDVSDSSICLYIGSSKKIVGRLKEHLFNYNTSAYAMHLEEWFDKEVKITIHLWNFSNFLKNENEDINFEYLQNIEDLLWNHYQPLLGRQGKK